MKGFTSGAFDLLHAGHMLFLREARSQCDWLIVGLHIDPSIERSWKHKPVESVEERMLRLQGCRYVDEIVQYNTEAEQVELIKQLRPDIRFLGVDWKGKVLQGDELFQKVIYLPRDHDYSSTSLRERLKS